MRVTAEFGVGLAVAVLFDALFVRMTLLPAVMSMCGNRNWALPPRLGRVLPNVSMEGVETGPDEDELGIVGSEADVPELSPVG
jgi:RND superfamily putative drug exporter